MFKDIDVVWIVVPFILAAFAARFLTKQQDDPLRDQLNKLQIVTVLTGAFLMAMWLILPATPSLSTFGYPEDVGQVNTPEKVLKFLQRYNQAIVRTADVVRWSLFIVVFWFIASVYQFIKVLKANLDNTKNNQ
jgi:cytochrome c biogenesis protein CcdA